MHAPCLLHPSARPQAGAWRRRVALAWALATTLALTACAQLEVSSQSSDPKRPVYELRGATLAQLQTDAARLCPQGFEVLRQAETDTRQPGGHKAIRWWNEGWSWLEDERRQAQMVLSCKTV